MDIDLGTLLVFKHLAQTGSFTETGRQWRISQPAVSLMIGRLESSAGLVLLERSSGGARLTAAGIQFLERVNEVCGAYFSFIDGMHSIGRRMDREVLVGVDRSWFSGKLVEVAGHLARVEGVKTIFQVVGGDWAEALESGKYDAMIAGRFLRAGLTPGIQEAVIHRERGITVAWNPDFYPFDEVHFSFPDILRSSVLLPDSGVVCGFASHIELWCEYAYGTQPANAVPFACEMDAAAAANAGLGVLLAPGDAMPRIDLAKGSLTHVRTFEFLLPEAYTYGIYCRSDENSKDVLATAASLGKSGRKLFARS